MASARVVAAREVSSLLRHEEAGVAAMGAELELEVGGQLATNHGLPSFMLPSIVDSASSGRAAR